MICICTIENIDDTNICIYMQSKSLKIYKMLFWNHKDFVLENIYV